MNAIRSNSVKDKGFRKGFISRLAVLAFGAALYLSASGSNALAAPISQLEYLQFLVQLSGDNLGPTPSPADYVNWARSRGLNPDGGWQTGAKLSKDTVAQTVAQLLNIVPRKKTGNYVALLAQNGIVVPNGNQISRTDLADFIDTGLSGWLGSLQRVSPSRPGGRPPVIPPPHSKGQGKGPGSNGPAYVPNAAR